jgi:signal transduction histidine kinase
MVVPLLVQGRRTGYVIFGRCQGEVPYTREDITLAEELARKASVFIENAKLYEKAQKAVDARNDFVAMVSHDLKNPLSAILLNTAFMRRGFAREEKLSEKELRFSKQIEAMERSAQRMNSLICDFLDLARIESGRLSVERQSYRIATLVNDTIEMLEPTASLKSITISKKIEISTETGYFDRDRIYQVLSNLVGNAVKFSPSNAEVKIQVGQSEEGLLFSVTDNGPGIPGHQRPHVFDRYWQAKDNYRAGSGLGLNIAKGIVEAHGGRIWLESEPGQGSTFFFSLPHPMN